jgi:hypothetical protein
MKQYKITGKKQWANAWIIIIYILLCIMGVMYFLYTKGIDNIQIAIWVFGIGFLSQLLPQVALHLNYYSVNKGDIFLYDALHQEMIFNHYGKEIRFYVSDIALVKKYVAYAVEKKTIPILVTDSYSHVIIILHDGTKIALTSLLMGEDFEIPVDKDKIKLVMYPYRWVNGPSLQLPTK